ncbi:MAG: hypothetical protein IJM55_07595 [Ruminococcus sp.]|nr:hypothetical protein [Ruminococcus sp.]
MEEFRRKLKTKRMVLTMFCMSGLCIYFALNWLTDGVPDFARGLIMGIFVGMEVAAVYYAVRLTVLLSSEDKLKEEYIKENDERNAAIQKETARTASVISLMLAALASVAAGFFQPVVSMTLAADILAGAIITVLVQAYYNKKM